RRPAAFRVDDPRLVLAPSELAPDAPGAIVPSDMPPPIPPGRRWRWGALFWSAASGLVMLALGIAVSNLIEDLFARSPWLGGAGAPWRHRVVAGAGRRGPAQRRSRRRPPRGGGAVVADAAHAGAGARARPAGRASWRHHRWPRSDPSRRARIARPAR